MSEYAIETRGLNKFFGSTHANVNIDFSVRRGEIRGLAGENGSGKSTLLSQIAGIYRRNSGEILINGQAYSPQSPKDAIAQKIGFVVQELGVLGTLTAGLNVYINDLEKFSKFGFVNIKKLYREAAAQLEKYGFPPVPLRVLSNRLPVETRKTLELARALSIDPEVLILDEVTQSLSHNNREALYKIIKNLKDENKTVILISHDIEEMLAICDSISVLRDGELISTLPCEGTSDLEVKHLMVGRDINKDYYRPKDEKASAGEEVVLAADNITVAGEIYGVSFELRKGEILGFCGLSDSGIHSVGKAAYGLSQLESGSVRLPGSAITNERDSLAGKLAYVPKDRDAEALMTSASIKDNMALPSLPLLGGALGFIPPKSVSGLAENAVSNFKVKCTGINQRIAALSGGNKQKINLGRWMSMDLDAIILDCPSRGVDVGVKAYIYQVMMEAKKRGLGIIMISDELSEILGMSDRLIVMKDGKVVREIERGEDFNEEKIIEVMA